MMGIESAFNNFVGYFCMLRSSFRTDGEKSEIFVRWIVLFAIACRNVLMRMCCLGKAVEEGREGYMTSER